MDSDNDIRECMHDTAKEFNDCSHDDDVTMRCVPPTWAGKYSTSYPIFIFRPSMLLDLLVHMVALFCGFLVAFWRLEVNVGEGRIEIYV